MIFCRMQNGVVWLCLFDVQKKLTLTYTYTSTETQSRQIMQDTCMSLHKWQHSRSVKLWGQHQKWFHKQVEMQRLGSFEANKQGSLLTQWSCTRMPMEIATLAATVSLLLQVMLDCPTWMHAGSGRRCQQQHPWRLAQQPSFAMRI